MKSEPDLIGKVVVITGAGRGIGRQIAKGAGERGAQVALVEVIKDNLDSAVAELSSLGIKARGYLTDISDEAQINNNFAQIEKDFGRIDALVNNAMIHDPEDLLATSLELWNRTLAITLTGSFLSIKARNL
jgi:NAD(P)-dependent dehydrogenase (short-subunit alcohol dehydrogenase family)